MNEAPTHLLDALAEERVVVVGHPVGRVLAPNVGIGSRPEKRRAPFALREGTGCLGSGGGHVMA